MKKFLIVLNLFLLSPILFSMELTSINNQFQNPIGSMNESDTDADSIYYSTDEISGMIIKYGESDFSEKIAKSILNLNLSDESNFSFSQEEYNAHTISALLNLVDEKFSLNHSLQPAEQETQAINSLLSVWNSKNQEIEKLSSENKGLKNKNSSLITQINQLKNQETQIQKLTREKNILETEVKNLNQEKTKAETDFNNLQNQIPSIKWKSFQGGLLGSLMIGCAIYFGFPKIHNYLPEQFLRYFSKSN